MYVPNYIPSPIEVPGNVTEKPYRVRLGFVRRVAVLHLASLLAVAGLAMLNLPRVPLPVAICGLVLLLVLLSLVRISTRATRNDLVLSASLLPFVLLAWAAIAQELGRRGLPIWGVLAGCAAATLYALACGRDFSFVGQYLMSLVASSVVLALVALEFGMPPSRAAFLLGSNLLFLFYVIYDSASLLARRRLGEELAAVVDLYRDVLNIFGYLVRVARHWRTHRIWAR